METHWGVFVVLVIIFIAIAIWTTDIGKISVLRWNKSNYGLSINTINSKYASVWTNSNKKIDNERSLDYIASAIIKISLPDTKEITGNDTEEVIFMGTIKGKDDALLAYRDGRLVDKIEFTNLSDSSATTYAAVAIDLNNDGLDDLIIARSNGVKLYLQKGNNKFIVKEILPKSDDTIPVSLAVSDLNNDGEADLYVSNFSHPNNIMAYKFGENPHVKNKILYQKNGKWVDITNEVGGNTYTAAFINLNSDKLADLIVADSSGLDVYKNNKGRFKKVDIVGKNTMITDMRERKAQLHLNVDNDTFEKTTYTHTTDTKNPSYEYKYILRNDGDFKFVNISENTKDVIKNNPIDTPNVGQNIYTRVPGMISSKNVGAMRANASSKQNASLGNKGINDDPLLSNSVHKFGILVRPDINSANKSNMELTLPANVNSKIATTSQTQNNAKISTIGMYTPSADGISSGGVISHSSSKKINDYDTAAALFGEYENKPY